MSDETNPAAPPNWLERPPENYRVVSAGDGFVYVDKSSHVENATIGRFSYINHNCLFTGKFPIVVGSFTMIAAGCYCHTRDSHTMEHVTAYPLRTILGVEVSYNELVEKEQGIVIGNDVWIGDQVRLNPGITIGNGVIVAARSVVTKDLEPFGVYGGVPARLIRYKYSRPVIDALQDIQWWRWPLDKIRRNTAFFNLNLSQLSDPAVLYAAIVP